MKIKTDEEKMTFILKRKAQKYWLSLQTMQKTSIFMLYVIFMLQDRLTIGWHGNNFVVARGPVIP